MRTAFVETLRTLMKEHKDVIAVTADMGFSVFENIQDEFPDRFFNTGVTEQSTIGLATGLALSGYNVFVYAQAVFITMRCFEQVRLDVGYNHVNVKLVGTATGFSLNQLGVSHFSTEDIALMRTIPGMTVFAPGDPVEARWATTAAYRIDGPAYIRIGKAGDPTIHTTVPRFQVGKGVIVRQGNDIVIFAASTLLARGVAVVSALRKYHISATLVSMPTIKPLDTTLIHQLANRTKAIFSLEEHNVIGGLGSAIAETLAEGNHSVVFRRIGIPDVFTSVTGSHEYLLAKNGLSVPAIIKTIRSARMK